ncbi:MAG TPA: hypothetical protein ENI77_03675 [Nitrospirae bacterium]|nr:hypothetical protein [Nitrospirota bacterium]
MKEGHFFDKPQNVKRFLMGFYISLVLLIVADFFVPKHADFPWESFPSFYATYGFVACVGLVLVAKYVLRPLVKRDENYYD